MNYPDSIERLLSDDAFARYAMSTDGNQQSLADLQALNSDSIQKASSVSATSGNPNIPDSTGISGNHGNAGSAEDMAAACVSGLWLLHNYLDASHDISQSIDSPAGSHWHAIMHRLEGDFSNSKYWYRRVGSWPVYDQVEKISGQPFDPMAFVDQVESCGSDATHRIAVAEWRTLFAFCFNNAAG